MAAAAAAVEPRQNTQWRDGGGGSTGSDGCDGGGGGGSGGVGTNDYIAKLRCRKVYQLVVGDGGEVGQLPASAAHWKVIEVIPRASSSVLCGWRWWFEGSGLLNKKPQ